MRQKGFNALKSFLGFIVDNKFYFSLIFANLSCLFFWQSPWIDF